MERARAYMSRSAFQSAGSFLLFTAALAASAQGGGGVRVIAPSSGVRTGIASAPHSASMLPVSPAVRGGLAPGGNFGLPPLNSHPLFLPPGITSTAPINYGSINRRYGPGGDRRASGVGAGYGVYGGFAAGYPIGYGYGDAGFAYANSDAYDPLDPNNTPAFAPTLPYAEPAPQAADAPALTGSPVPARSARYAAPPQESADSNIPELAPAAPRVAAEPSAPLPEEDAVTIVFKDGRPNEKIKNYALTRTMLYVTTSRVRSIPVEEIDIPATEKLNEREGVEFQLPEKQ